MTFFFEELAETVFHIYIFLVKRDTITINNQSRFNSTYLSTKNIDTTFVVSPKT